MKPDSTPQLVKLKQCSKDIKTWTTSHFLLMNSDKKGLLHLACSRNMLSNQALNLGDITLVSSTTARNLGLVFEQGMSFKVHIK